MAAFFISRNRIDTAMYQYDTFDEQLVQERVTDFREQTNRYLAGELDEEAFKPLRLMNGLYIQRHAPMLRVAIPYGVLSSRQLRMLASIATGYDRGYGHFTTRQNIQFNWPDLERVPDILQDLASVDMHAIQTSGNCIRNITCDHLAGVATDEVADPRPYCELLRQWSTLHPEFSYLPRKFKIAVTGALRDRAVTEVHDIGLRLVGERRRRARLRSPGRRRAGAHARDRQGADRVPSTCRSSLLPPGDHPRLQPGGTARQQVQGPHQDPGQRARDRRVSPAGRSGVGR